MEKHVTNTKQKKAGIARLISNKADFKAKKHTKNKNHQIKMIKY